jgi:hypothetical protein
MFVYHKIHLNERTVQTKGSFAIVCTSNDGLRALICRTVHENTYQ